MAEVSTLDELKTRRIEIAALLEAKRMELTDLRAHEQQAADQLAQGQDIHNKIVEREQAENHLSDIESKRAEYADKRSRLERARRAAELIELENAILNQQRDAEDIEGKRQTAQGDWETAVELERQAVEALAREIGRQGERDEARRTKDRLDNLQGQVGELDQAGANFKAAKTLSDEAGRTRDTAKSHLDNLQKQLEKLEQALADAETVALGLVAAQQAEAKAREAHDQWLKLRDVAGSWKSATQKEADEAQRLQLVDIEVTRARNERDRLEEAWRKGQAALLAGQLADNTPCPVCGSIHHPHPATSSHTSPSDADLKAARVAVSSLEVQSQKARDELAKSHEATVRFDEARKPFVDSLGEKARVQLSQIKGELGSARSALKEAQDKASQMEALKRQHGPLKEQLSQASIQLLSAEDAYEKAATQQATAKAILNERQSKVPAELDEPRKLRTATQQNESIIRALELALETAQTNDSQARQHLASCRATLDQLSEQASTAKRRAEEQRNQFAERTVASGFTSVNGYERSKLSPQAIGDLDGEIRAYDGSLQAAKDRVERALLATHSLVKPDLEQLLAVHRQAKDDVESAVRHESELQTWLTGCDGHSARLTKIEESLSQKEGEYSVVGRIAEVANGDNAYKMTFHRFVLSALLEDILVLQRDFGKKLR